MGIKIIVIGRKIGVGIEVEKVFLLVLQMKKMESSLLKKAMSVDVLRIKAS